MRAGALALSREQVVTAPRELTMNEPKIYRGRDACWTLKEEPLSGGTYLSSFMAMSKGSVSPSSSTITGAHILQGQREVREAADKAQRRWIWYPDPHLARSPGQVGMVAVVFREPPPSRGKAQRLDLNYASKHKSLNFSPHPLDPFKNEEIPASLGK